MEENSHNGMELSVNAWQTDRLVSELFERAESVVCNDDSFHHCPSQQVNSKQ
jgi:hypothetical protein